MTLVQTGGFALGVGARVRVLSPACQEITAFNSNTQRRVVLPIDGTYVMLVNATNLFHAGTFNLGLERLQPRGAIDAVLDPGDLISAALVASAEVDVFTFSGQSGDRILLTLVQTGGFALGVGARATVLAPDGMQTDAFNTNSQRTLTLGTTGTFTVWVNATNLFHAGTYNIGFERLQPLGPSNGHFDPGDLIIGSLTASSQVNVYTFSGQSGDRVLLTLVQTGGFALGVGARATVLTPGGAQFDAFNSNGQRNLTLPESGTFIVYVNATNLFHAGTYNLGFERLNPLGPVAGNLNPGDLLSGGLTASAQVDVYTFSGQSGSQVLLTLVQTSGFALGVGARATVIAPSGVQVDAFNSNAQRTLTLGESGTYIVHVNATNLFHAGTYNIGRQ